MNIINNSHYKELSKELKKHIEVNYPPERKMIKEEGTRGAPSRFSNNDLIEIALEVKKALRGESLNPHKLELITGIGRQTWARRISNDLNEINSPVVKGRDFGIESDDEIFHTNIDYIVERYSDNPKKLINHLYHIEESRYRFYNQIQELEKKIQLLEEYRKDNKKLNEENAILKKMNSHYEQQYNKLVISSFFPGLRRETGAKENILDLSRANRLDDLNLFFEGSSEIAAATQKESGKMSTTKGNDTATKLINEFSGLFEDE